MHLDYDTYKQICLEMAQKLKEWNPHEIVCIMRGGMTASHIISRELNIPVGVYYPHNKKLMLARDNDIRLVFVEDMISRGKTFVELHEFMKTTSYKWVFAPTAIDGKIEFKDLPDNGKHIYTYGIKTNMWLVAPYDDPKNLPVGKIDYSRDSFF